MTYIEVQPIALAIMTSIITGGFVLVFVEIGNRKNRENDRHDGIIGPFIHKLSAYFRFMSWCHGHIAYPRELNGNEIAFKNLIEKIRKYGDRLILSGGDYFLDSFSAERLHEIAIDINNIWYYYDKMRPCNLQWEETPSSSDPDYISKELREVNPMYITELRDIHLVAKVSGDFYCDIYQPVEFETYRHEAYLKQYNNLTIWVSVFFSIVLLILCLMLFVHLPVRFIQVASVVVVLMLISSLLLLAIDVKVFVECRGKRKQRKERRKAYFFISRRRTKTRRS